MMPFHALLSDLNIKVYLGVSRIKLGQAVLLLSDISRLFIVDALAEEFLKSLLL